MTIAHADRNYRRLFFYAVEIVYALIAGVAEAYVYAAYLPSGPLSSPEAIARATITQVIIVLFGVAAIEAWDAAGGGWRGFLATLPINIGTTVAALVAVWFMRESALVFRHQDMLIGADTQPFILPNGMTLSSVNVDPWLVAALPIFQVGLNWLAPIICRNHALESPDARTARHDAELARARHDAELKAIKAAGLRNRGLALIGKIDPLNEPPSPATDGHDDGPAGAGLPPADTGTDGPDLAGQSKRRAGISPLRGVPANVMTAPQLVAWLRDELGVSIRDDDATAFVRNLPGAAKLDRVRGAPWAASKAQVKARARQKWGVQPTGKVAGD